MIHFTGLLRRTTCREIEDARGRDRSAPLSEFAGPDPATMRLNNERVIESSCVKNALKILSRFRRNPVCANNNRDINERDRIDSVQSVEYPA